MAPLKSESYVLALSNSSPATPSQVPRLERDLRDLRVALVTSVLSCNLNGYRAGLSPFRYGLCEVGVDSADDWLQMQERGWLELLLSPLR